MSQAAIARAKDVYYAAVDAYHQAIAETFKPGHFITYRLGQHEIDAMVVAVVGSSTATAQDRIYVRGAKSGRFYWIHEYAVVRVRAGAGESAP